MDELLRQFPMLQPIAAVGALILLGVGGFFFLRFANRKLWSRFVMRVSKALAEMGKGQPK